MNLVGEDDETLVWTIPDGLGRRAERKPGEYAVTVGQQEALGAEVASHGEAAVFIGQLRIREPYIAV